MDLSDGTVIAGRYRLAERLGGGGMGEVWRARDQRLLVDVAAKRLVLDPHATREQRRTALAYAVKESRHAAALRTHPNVAAVHDVIEDDDGIPWTVMDLVAGRSLAQALAIGDRFGPDQAARIGRQVLEALDAAHAQGITHRDVKPGNIMLADDGRILLVDFGIARHHSDTKITQTGMAVGTVEYMAPERFDGTDGPPGDLWALGVTLYETLDGISPFRRNTVMATIRAIAMDPPAPSASAGWLAEPILRLLDKDPGARPTARQTKVLLQSGQTAVTVSSTQTAVQPPTQPANIGTIPASRPPLTTEQSELLDCAVRIACSINGSFERAAALGEIAKTAPWLIDEIIPSIPADYLGHMLLDVAAGVDDIDLARRLIGEAEPLIMLSPDPDERAASHLSLALHLLGPDPAKAIVHIDGLLQIPLNAQWGLDEARGFWDLAVQAAGIASDRIVLLLDRVERMCLDHDFHSDEYAAMHIEALGELAGSMAVVDPDRARRLMGRVELAARELPPDPNYTFWLPGQLVDIANAGRDADTYCSRRLIDLAEQTALGLAKATDRNHALESVAITTARVDPLRAEQVIGHISERYIQASAWAGVIKEAAAGPGNALHLIDAAEQALVGPVQAREQVPAEPVQAEQRATPRWWRSRKTRQYDAVDLVENPEEDGSGDLVEVAVSAAAADPMRAEHLALRITDLIARVNALVGMANQAAASKPDQARRWLDAAYETAPQIRPSIYSETEGGDRIEALGAIAAAAADIDPALAVKAAGHLVSAIGNDEVLWTLVLAAEYLAAVDPAQAVRLVGLAESRRSEPPNDLQRLSLAKALVTASVASAATDLQHAKGLIRRAWQIVRRPPEVEQYVYQAWESLQVLAGTDPHTAEQLVDQLPGPDRDPLLAAVVAALAVTDPLRAEEAAHRIADVTLGTRALTKAALSLATYARRPASM
ncbi:serine/threonine-protein kinase [Streptomyces sp. NBC_01006]|uniref:serine/threonine-protein kinase n=1 Tax=Streptomyces sp. NBC_01006 TaxID=2903716 RepID=UPI002F919712|nr:serine/threonine protein kinase [Streptomyces sp. NBC_01006]